MDPRDVSASKNKKPECLSDSQCQGQKLSSSYHHRAKIGHETFPWNADSWGLMMSSMSEKPIIDDRKTDSLQDALNEIRSLLLSIAWFSIISCGIINQIPLSIPKLSNKNTTGLWTGWFHLVLLNLMKSIPKVCQTSETLKIFRIQASVTFLVSCR